MALDIDLVLVAVDGSDESQEAAESAAALAEQYEAELHLLHFVDNRVMRGIQTGDLSPETVAGEQQALSSAIREMLADSIPLSFSGATGYSTTKLGQTPGNIVLDVAEELSADFLVVPRETPSGDPDKVVGKAALHVLEYASQPVLSV
ncbi:universal stress protein [Halovenus rubra]|uniref:Universal stress protein n=2 Tax=Halovenus rubra TaxID=869890 RepID=A0ACC7E0Y4_9EURY|nr:universal stress protein [Halovenus rubra]